MKTLPRLLHSEYSSYANERVKNEKQLLTFQLSSSVGRTTHVTDRAPPPPANTSHSPPTSITPTTTTYILWWTMQHVLCVLYIMIIFSEMSYNKFPSMINIICTYYISLGPDWLSGRIRVCHRKAFRKCLRRRIYTDKRIYFCTLAASWEWLNIAWIGVYHISNTSAIKYITTIMNYLLLYLLVKASGNVQGQLYHTQM